MKMLFRFCWLALLLVPLSAGGYEQDYDSHEPYYVADVSLDQAASRVKQRTGGRVLSAKTRENVHSIKVLTPDGRVRSIRVDAKSGRKVGGR